MAAPQPENPRAHEIIVLPPQYHLSVHFPRSSLYADVWLGINMGHEDLLVHLSPLRRQALNTSPLERVASSRDASGASPSRRDSAAEESALDLGIRHSTRGLCDCPPGTSPLEWLDAKETLFEAKSICKTHHTKFAQAVAKIREHNRSPVPDLAPLAQLLDDMLDRNAADPGPIDSPTCGICSSSPYLRLFFSML
ncbi:hypothetical protein H4R18_003947 [Coemansia javaensis]|uniref:Uncharacterized protein n=1 Tax=Coemansia javaensis TaxID=2761396 RepID=A0A9W8HAG3_9FUNG|nr:hypothetical protein H4R18_003947 [Coemansia javaensis]